MKSKVVIWGAGGNRCQERDIKEALKRRGLEAEIWNERRFKERLEGLRREKEKGTNYFVLIRNFFYSGIDNYLNYEESGLIKKLRELEEETTFLGGIDSLVLVRDKLRMNEVFRELKIPHIKTYELENKPFELVRWINETAEHFSNGIIIKDRFGGLGKGIVKAKKQGSVYVCDISCVEGFEQKYINETLNADELRDVFKRYMSSYVLIGQPYIKSSHEFNTVKESESIRVLDTGQAAYLAMRRIAESPINNINLTKSKLVNGQIQKTKSSTQEREFCRKISEHLCLFLTGYDFIRTKIPYYRDDPGSVYIPSHLRGEEDISLMLEVNGLVQYTGIQELYKNYLNITEYVVSAIEERVKSLP